MPTRRAAAAFRRSCSRAWSGSSASGAATFAPVPLMHGSRTILGYRVGSFAYLTDCSEIPDASWPLLSGVRTRDPRRAARASASDAPVASIRRSRSSSGSRPSARYFTHMCHDLPHAATCARLPAGVELAYDGLTFEIDL